MIVDTSVPVSVLLREPEREDLLNAMARAPRRAMGAPSRLEACKVINRRDSMHARKTIDRLFNKPETDVVVFDGSLVDVTRVAFREYGRGSDHPAKHTGEPLLFMGNDFIHTDTAPARA